MGILIKLESQLQFTKNVFFVLFLLCHFLFSAVLLTLVSFCFCRMLSEECDGVEREKERAREREMRDVELSLFEMYVWFSEQFGHFV